MVNLWHSAKYAARAALSVGLLLGSGLVFAQGKPLKIYISADMEGIGGVVSEHQLSRDQPEYERFRELMTAEVNAAIEGALEAGAKEIVVSDSHGRGENLLVEKLNPVARLVRSFPRPLDMMEGIDSSFSAALFIGYHASHGMPNAIVAHSGNRRILSFKVNGINLPEGGVNAGVAGYFGVPVVLVSGDDATIAEMRKLVGDVEGAEVKKALGIFSGITIHPNTSQALIRQRTKAALARLGDFKPYHISGPIQVEASSTHVTDAELLSLIPGVERVGGDTIRIQLKDMVEVAKFFNLMMWIDAP